MTTQIVSTYVIALTTGLQSIARRMAATPLDLSLLSLYGIGVTSDVTTGSITTTPTRTITLFTVPAVLPVVTPVLFGGDASGSPLNSVTVNTQGGSLAAPPVLTLSNPAGAPAPVKPAHMVPVLGITAVGVNPGGSGYSFDTTLTASGGGLAYGGTQATFSVTILDGGVDAVTVLTPGGPYTDLNSLVLTLENTGGGTGAVLTPTLGLISVTVTSGGEGYVAGCSILVSPYFKRLFPDSAGAVAQASSVNGWMLQPIQNATKASVTQTTVAS